MPHRTETTLWAISDVHVRFARNREVIGKLARPDSAPGTPQPGDWLIVAGDVAEKIPDVVSTLRQLRERFARVIWVPGNHELFNRPSERLVGKARYRALVGQLRAAGIDTPEDPYPVFGGVSICPLFTLYDYSFGPVSLDQARVRLDDAIAIAPYVDIPAWCQERLEYSRARLDLVRGPTILVNHWPLVIEPTRRLAQPELALWCGTVATREWPVRYHAKAVVYGHLHMPGQMMVDGIAHIDASLGYPFEPHRRAGLGARPSTAPGLAPGAGASRRPWPVPLAISKGIQPGL